MSDLSVLVEELVELQQDKEALIEKIPILKDRVSQRYISLDYVYILGLWFLDHDVAPGTKIPEELIVSYVQHSLPDVKSTKENTRQALRKIKRKNKIFDHDGIAGNLSYFLPEREELSDSFRKYMKTHDKELERKPKKVSLKKIAAKPVNYFLNPQKIAGIKNLYTSRFLEMRPEILDMYNGGYPMTYNEIAYNLIKNHPDISTVIFPLILPKIISDMTEEHKLMLQNPNIETEGKTKNTKFFVNEYYKDSIAPLGTSYLSLLIEIAENTAPGDVLLQKDILDYSESGRKKILRPDLAKPITSENIGSVLESLVERGFVNKVKRGYVTQEKLYECYRYSSK